MILYSIVPIDIVYGNNYEETPELLEIEYMGEKVQVYPINTISNNNISKDKYVINRIISTSPKSFLNNKLQPGTIIDF